MRILLVGDSNIQNDAVGMILETNGHEIRRLSPNRLNQMDSEESHPQFDLSIIDLLSFRNRMDGTVMRLKRHGWSDKVIVLSPTQSDDMLRYLETSGTDRLVFLDSEVEDLLAAIEDLG